MEPRPGPSLTPNRDDGPFSPGDVVAYDNGERPRWYRNWLEEAGQGIVLGCSERGGKGCGYWFCSVQVQLMDGVRMGQRKQGNYKAATLKLLRSVTTMRQGWQTPPVSAISALRAAEV